MQKQREANYLLTVYSKVALIILVSLALLSGCAAPEKKVETTDKKTVKPEEQISPEARKDYDAALQAMRGGDNGKAKALLASLSTAYPALSGPYTNLGLIYFREGNIDEAEKAFLQAIKVNPKSAVSYNHLGIINRGKGKFPEAKTFYQKALDINDEYAYAHLNIGILYDLYLGELEAALDHYQRFQELNPKEDKEVKKWIVDLERRIKTANR